VAAVLKAEGKAPADVSTHGLIYRPALYAQASVRFLDRKHDVDEADIVTALVEGPDRRGVVRWEEFRIDSIPAELLDEEPLPHSRFADLEAPLTDGKLLRQLEKDYLDYVYRSSELRLLSNPELDLIADPGVTKAEFLAQCSEAARRARDDEIDEIRESYMKKVEAIQKKIMKEERELTEDEAEYSARKMEEMATHFENVLGIFGGSRSRRRISSSMTKRRLTTQAKADIEESKESIEVFKRDLANLEAEMQEAVEEVEDRWGKIATEIDEEVIQPYKKNVLMDYFGVAWVPYWQLQEGDEGIELRGFSGG
jgi:hypothetical protein